MKAIVFVALISLISVALAQPSLDGRWVSDSCEPAPGQSSSFNYYYVRNYTFDSSVNTIHLEIKIYSSTCQINNQQATVVYDGIYVVGGASQITPGCDINGTESAVYDIQFFYNTSKTITTVKSSNFANKIGPLCGIDSLTDGVTADISTINCQVFQMFYPCTDGEHDVISVINSTPKRFHNGVRTNDNICQLLNRPTQLTTNACVLDGTGPSGTPASCTAYVAPVAPPVAAPVAVPVTPPVPKKSIGSFVFSSSILVLAAGVVAFF